MSKRTLTAEERQILLSEMQYEAKMYNIYVADMRLSDKDYNGSRQCFVNHKARLSTMVYLFSYMFDCEIKTEMRDGLYTFVSVDGEIREMDSYTEKEEI